MRVNVWPADATYVKAQTMKAALSAVMFKFNLTHFNEEARDLAKVLWCYGWRRSYDRWCPVDTRTSVHGKILHENRIMISLPSPESWISLSYDQ